jgi:hypothetical protein
MTRPFGRLGSYQKSPHDQLCEALFAAVKAAATCGREELARQLLTLQLEVARERCRYLEEKK